MSVSEADQPAEPQPSMQPITSSAHGESSKSDVKSSGRNKGQSAVHAPDPQKDSLATHAPEDGNTRREAPPVAGHIPVCYYCGEKGHMKVLCEKRPAERRNAESSQSEQRKAEFRKRSCYFCGIPGHLWSSCRKRKQVLALSLIHI